MRAFKSRTPESIVKTLWSHHPHLGRRRRGCARGLAFTEMGLRNGILAVRHIYFHKRCKSSGPHHHRPVRLWLDPSGSSEKKEMERWWGLETGSCSQLVNSVNMDAAFFEDIKLQLSVFFFLFIIFFKSPLSRLQFESDASFWDCEYRFFFWTVIVGKTE